MAKPPQSRASKPAAEKKPAAGKSGKRASGLHTLPAEPPGPPAEDDVMVVTLVIDFADGTREVRMKRKSDASKWRALEFEEDHTTGSGRMVR